LSGGSPFGHPPYAGCGKISNVIPVDVEVPGCPPTPTALFAGFLIKPLPFGKPAVCKAPAKMPALQSAP